MPYCSCSPASLWAQLPATRPEAEDEAAPLIT